MCPTRAEKQEKRLTTDLLCQKPDAPLPQETRTTKHPRRPESKPRVPDDTTQRIKDVASASPKETEAGKQQRCRQNRSPSIVVPAANSEDNTPEQQEVREHLKKSFKKVFQECGYRTRRKDN
jgi:DNA polymerase III gamma/tau subunit